MPVSSRTSRCAQINGSSPGSSVPAGQLQHVEPGGVPVLAHEVHISLLVHRHDHSRTDVFDNIQFGRAPIWQADDIAADVECASFVNGFRIRSTQMP